LIVRSARPGGPAGTEPPADLRPHRPAPPLLLAFALASAAAAGLSPPFPGALAAAAAIADSTGAAPGPRATVAGRGSLLVADRSLSRTSSPFAETVVLLLEHRPAGAIGIVLNQPGDRRLSTIEPSLGDLGERDETVHAGGPLERERLVLVVQAPEAPRDSLRIFDDVWVTGSTDAVRELVRTRKSDARFRAFAGRTIWGPAQLDEEIRRGEWLVAPADAASVFTTDPAGLWRRLVDRLSARWVRAPNASGQRARIAA